MKKHYILFSFVLATIAMLAVGCQKEEITVTLGAEIQRPVSGDTKVYIDDHTPCWHNGDEVYINNTAYPIMAATGTSARIENVLSSSNYRAIFPASLVTAGSDISSNSSISVTLPTTQHYELVGDNQLVDVPMGAFLTSGSTLQFYNLCSIVRVIVSNSLNRELQLSRIELRAETAMLSGQGTAIISGQSTDHITLSSTASHSVNLNFINDISVTVEARGSRMFDIVVPAFTTDDVTLTLYTTDGYYSEVTKEEVALAHNTITTVTMNVSSLTEVVAAELVDGPTFNRIMNRFPLAVYSATSIVFEYGSSITSGIILSTADSPVPIYANRVGSVVRISTSARMINANPDCSFMFGCDWVGDGVGDPMETIDFGSGFNTTNVTDMQGMFDGLGALRNLDVSNFNTSNVTTMYGMFGYCYGLENLDVSHFNTSSVTNMKAMFASCSELTSLEVSNFNTSNVTDMGGMFGNCSSLTSLDVSNFNTSNVTDMGGMFVGCSGLTSLNLSSFNTENVTDMNGLFSYCNSLTNLNLSSFNTSNVEDMSGMFGDCSSLTNLNLSSFNTSNVEDMNSMFYNCNSLTNLNLSSFNTSNVEDMFSMFENCASLTSLNLSSFNTENVWSMARMFNGCSSLTSLNISNFNTSNVVQMGRMFSGCSSLTSLNLSNFYTTSVVNMQAMFMNCSNLTSLNLAHFNMSNLESSANLWNGYYYLTIWTGIPGKYYMCYGLSTTSHSCIITCPLEVENAIKELDPYFGLDPDDPSLPEVYYHFGVQPYYFTGLPTSGVTFTWQRPSSK